MYMSCTNEYAIAVVRKYIARLGWFGFGKDDRYAETLAYERWAANEILTLLKLRRREPPLTVIEEFADKVNKYSTFNAKTSFAFSTAYDVAIDILEIFIK